MVLCASKVVSVFIFFTMTSWHGKVFRVTGVLWVESANYQWIPSINSQQCKGYYGFFIVNLDKLLNTQSSLLWFNCDAIPLKWRHHYGISGTYGMDIYRVLHTSRCLVYANPLAFNEPIDFLSQGLVGHITCTKVMGSTISYRIASLFCVSLPPISSWC